jgi:nicotinamidase-related amidase
MRSGAALSTKTAVLALDLQRDFLEEAGRMPVARNQVDGLVVAANAVIDRAAAKGVPVVYVLNEFRRSDWLLNLLRRGAAVVGSPGAELDPRVHVVGSARFPKWQTSAFTNPALDAFLREQGATHLVTLGLYAPHCLRATVAAALERGYEVTVVSDAVAAASDRSRDKALERMKRGGASLATSDAAL